MIVDIVAREPGSVPGVTRRNRHATAVRIQQNFAGIEPHAARRIVGSMHAISVELALP